MKNILIVDDDAHINNMLKERLTIEGYSINQAFSGTETKLLLANVKPDLILLDLMLPGLTGEELLPEIKDIPVIVLSAKSSVSSKVDLLLKGASDYITKPFEMDELLARIAVQIRKNNNKNTNELIFNEIKLNIDTHLVYINDDAVKLTRTEYSILKLLMNNPNQVISKSAILENIFIDTPDCTEDSLKIHVHNLRKKLNDKTNKDYIKSIWGIGFMISDKS